MIDLPDALFRKTKALAALQGCSLKDLIVRAIENETKGTAPAAQRLAAGGFNFPHLRLRQPRKLDLTNFDFDELLG
jgi:hypothetical protein